MERLNCQRWLSIAAVLLLTLSTSAADLPGGAGKRRLSQTEGEAVEVTQENQNDLKGIIENAGNGTVVELLSGETIEITEKIVLTTSVTLRGSGKGPKPTIKCTDANAGLEIRSDAVTLQGFVLQDCAGPALLVALPDEDGFACFNRVVGPTMGVTIEDVDFINNKGPISSGIPDCLPTGGALGVGTGTKVSVRGCRFEGNSAQQGGAIMMQIGSFLNVTDSLFRGNEAVTKGAGAGIYAGQSTVLDGEDSVLLVQNCEFIKNVNRDGQEDQNGLKVSGGAELETSQYIQFRTPALSGGAIHLSTIDNVEIVGCLFEENLSVPAGGALFILDNGSVRVELCNFTRNSVESPKVQKEPLLELGGAIYVAFVDPESGIEIIGCIFEENSASYGGALHIVSPVRPGVEQQGPIVSSSTFRRNIAFDSGGAIALRNSREISLVGIILEENVAISGGGIFFTNAAGANVRSGIRSSDTTRFANNWARDGGAWYAFGAGSIKVLSSRDVHIPFNNNKATRNGGAVAMVESLASAEMKMEDVIFENNTATKGGAIFLDSISNFALQESSGDSVNEKNVLRRNRAVAGGALYARPSSQIINNLAIKSASFFDNEAVRDITEELKEIDFPDTRRSSRGLLQLEKSDKEAQTKLLDPNSADPCNPGGGGAVCLVMTQVPDRASVKITVISSEFQNSRADVGGAFLIAQEKGSNWEGNCDSRSSSFCRELGFRGDMVFKGNQAKYAGGAIFASDPNNVYYSEKATGDNATFAPITELSTGGVFVENTVGERGYGENFASPAVRLEVASEVAANGYYTENHLSGRTLPEIKLIVKDSFNETIYGGISDSDIKIRVVSDTVSGQLVAGAERGDVLFDAVTATALPGDYLLTFVGANIPNVTTRYTVRPCMIGEFNVTENKVCTNCTQGFYGIRPEVQCDRCSPNAICPGGPVLVPKNGFWHSTPYSPQVHECLLEAACSYRGRTSNLTSFFKDRAELNPSNTVLLNEEYRLCNEGYEGVLCGSCASEYGHVGGGECSDCGDKKSRNIGYIFMVAIWNLILMLFTIRSALSSIRDLREVQFMADQQSQKRSLQKPDASLDDSGDSTMANGEDESASNSSGDTPITSKKLLARSESRPEERAIEQGGDSLSVTVSQRFTESIPGQRMNTGPNQPGDNRLVTADHIIGAENLSETVKITTNFLQVTSVALHINANWTQTIAKMLAVQEVLTSFSGGTTLTPLDCVLSSGPKTRSIQALVMRIFFPILIMGFIILMTYVIVKIRQMKNNPPRLMFRQYAIIITIVTLFFAYEKVSQELMRTLNCVEVDQEVDPEKDKDARVNEVLGSIGNFWAEDTVHLCFKGGHFWLVAILGVPGLILFAFGIPFAILCFLEWKKAKKQLDNRDFINTYGFLFQNYTDKFVYWEVVIMTRKALINGIVVFAYPLGANLQGVLAQGVLVIAFGLQLVAHPYKYFTLNLLESASLVVSIFTFYSGIMYNDDNTSDLARFLLSAGLLALNFCLVILVVWRGYHLIDMIVTARLQNLGSVVRVIPDSFIGRVKCLLQAYLEMAKEKMEKAKNKGRDLKNKVNKLKSMRARSMAPRDKGENRSQMNQIPEV